jgi:deazaflavin-dependent oxidoreductase (nitroreductase family)
VRATSVITIILLILAAYVLLIVVWRLRVRSVIDAIRHFNRGIFNPAMMRLAGRHHWYASVLHHKGRRSGKWYATPLGVAPIDGGFVIPLAYGEGVDWLKNVLAEGRARIQTKGETYVVVDPEVRDTSTVLGLVPVGWRVAMRFIRIYGVDLCLKLKRDRTYAAIHPTT